ncbi:hypothetical protein CCR83_14295 [Rhodobacter veldkampii DSM 11550]|uniref:Protein pufQ n=1 Tax=Phaeovulum veldkampii DSM 11550 TaxID=1185920 RepID=A0A2T4JIM0_9RHOB|nr:cytochrome PufQ [Phaeovulum veldkampii]MBK5947586.1 hypothetical protein [Phaeovulum veldkampii DSM 11550]NCU20377.1 protein pufQ [Candidatus Falkowbacteria bacterium]PTE17760.1 protein pufQ [Phaeovulum veldkampii DSM 11550]TDQ58167.1 PufQ cytochrome subunit [Phaeovulum veldkampii DSM 11550]
MTNHGVDTPKGRCHRASRAEYKVFFTLIFMLALPFAILGWAAAPLLRGGFPSQGPIARALEEAGSITPMIFLA